jgi:hypothetical protein
MKSMYVTLDFVSDLDAYRLTVLILIPFSEFINAF